MSKEKRDEKKKKAKKRRDSISLDMDIVSANDPYVRKQADDKLRSNRDARKSPISDFI